jgi:hypothetical protein
MLFEWNIWLAGKSRALEWIITGNGHTTHDDLFTQKGVMISHRNVIANILQTTAFEQDYRDAQPQPANGVYTEIGQCLLPQSHIYSLVVVCHSGTYRGDQTVVLPKFDMTSYLASIQRFKITSLFLVSISLSIHKSEIEQVPSLLITRFLRSLST